MIPKKPFDYDEYLQDAVPYLTMDKKYSKTLIQFYVDPEVEWFHYVVTRYKKTKKIDHTSMIIAKDVDDWVSYKQSLGWKTP